jgi:hypothetical protein
MLPMSETDRFVLLLSSNPPSIPRSPLFPVYGTTKRRARASAPLGGLFRQTPVTHRSGIDPLDVAAPFPLLDLPDGHPETKTQPTTASIAQSVAPPPPRTTLVDRKYTMLVSFLYISFLLPLVPCTVYPIGHCLFY